MNGSNNLPEQSQTKRQSIMADQSIDNRLIYIQPFGDENVMLPMTRRAARLSGYLGDLIDLIDQKAFDVEVENSTNIDSANCPTIPLINHTACNVNTMKNIIRWCEYHCDDPKLNDNNFEDSEEDEYARRTRKLEELPSYWDRRFLADIAGDEDQTNGWQNRADLYDLLIAAHFLRINPIVEIGGKFICQSIRERNVEQVRNFLGIINDLSEDDNILSNTDRLTFNFRKN